MPTPVVTLTEIKAFINLRDGDTSQDTLLTMLSTQATSDIEEGLGILLDKAQRSEFFATKKTLTTDLDFLGASQMGVIYRSQHQMFRCKGLFPDYTTPPVVELDYTGLFAGDGYDETLVEGTDYVYETEEGTNRLKVTMLRGTGRKDRALKITYTAGLAEGTAPDTTLSSTAPNDIKLAALYQIAFLKKRARIENVGHTDEAMVHAHNVKSHSNSLKRPWNVNMGLCMEAQGCLRSYRLPAMGKY